MAKRSISWEAVLVLFFPAFFVVFFFETVFFFGVKFSVLWKFFLLVYLVSCIIYGCRCRPALPVFLVFAYLFAFKNLIYADPGAEYIGTLMQSVKSFSFPLIIHYFFIRSTPQLAAKLILVVSSSVVLSVLPFLLGILNPIVSGYNLSIYGLEAEGLVGVFQNPHSAAITVSVSVLCLIYFFFRSEGFAKIFLAILIIVGVFFVYKTYVRTGYLMLVGPLLIWYLRVRSFRGFIKDIPIMVLCFGGLSYFYFGSEILQMRMADVNIHTPDNTPLLLRVGSGRMSFWLFAMISWIESGPLGWFIGVGYAEALTNMQRYIGVPIFAHNGFLDALHMNGLLGLLLIVLMYSRIWKFIKLNKGNEYSDMAINVFFAIICYVVFQGGSFFLVDLMFSLVLSLLFSDGSALKDGKDLNIRGVKKRLFS